MKTLLQSVLLTYTLGMLLLLLPAGCKHLSPRANAFASLEATQSAVHEGMNTYGALYRAGRIEAERAVKVREAHRAYVIGYDVALAALGFDTKAATPDTVRALAIQLLTLIPER